MTDQKPTGVFVPLHEGQLREDQIAKICNPKRTMTESLLAIGTPVQGGKFDIVGWVAPELFTHFGKIPTGTVVSSVMTDSRTLPLVRQSEAQAQIAVRDAEIVRLREENERLKHKLKPQFFCSDILEEDSMSTREELVEHARDYDDDLQPFSVFGMEGYAKTHTSHGFFDKDGGCHWFDTEQEALGAAKSLKGGAA